MPPKTRLDSELVRRGIARSRSEAARLIDTRQITVAGMIATKGSTNIDPSVAISMIDSNRKNWASRGSYKLLSALEVFTLHGLVVVDKKCLDAGAAHGGFTDVLLEYGADSVVAVDVGYGQLPWRLQSDDRVKVYDRTNIRYSNSEDFGGPVELIVSDLSFISLSLVLPALIRCIAIGGDILPMVKPQFEAQRALVNKRGVVDSPSDRYTSVCSIARYAAQLGCAFNGVVASALPGINGNVEYFLWLQYTGSPQELTEVDLEAISIAIREGPQ